MAKPTWLKAVEHGKRKTKDIPIFLDESLYRNLEELIQSVEWPYKSEHREQLVSRDKALVALLILSGLRVSEALKLKRKQFRIYQEQILLVNVETVKHGHTRAEIILPKRGNLARFTTIFEQWLRQIPETNEENFIFPAASSASIIFEKPLSRYRVHNIIKTLTGKFPHWFRAVCENIYGKKVFRNNAYKLKDFMGLVNLESTTPYIQAAWEEDKDKIFKL